MWLRVPGMGCTASIFDGLDHEGALPGHIRDVPIHGTTLVDAAEALASAALEAAAGQSPPRIGLVGLSLGAIIGMAALTRHPELFSAAILMSTNPRGPRPDQYSVWTQQRRDLANDDRGGLGGVATDLAAATYGPEPQHRQWRQLAHDMAVTVGAKALDDQLAIQGSRTDLRPGLASCTVETLVLCGDQDRLCTLEAHEEIASRMAHARLQVIPSAGHLLPVEAPRRTTSVITSWIERISA